MAEPKPNPPERVSILTSRREPSRAAEGLQRSSGHVQAGYKAAATDVGTKHRRLWLFTYTSTAGLSKTALAAFAVRGKDLVLYLDVENSSNRLFWRSSANPDG